MLGQLVVPRFNLGTTSCPSRPLTAAPEPTHLFDRGQLHKARNALVVDLQAHVMEFCLDTRSPIGAVSAALVLFDSLSHEVIARLTWAWSELTPLIVVAGGDLKVFVHGLNWIKGLLMVPSFLAN